jgi:hypothetical protein
LTAPLVHLDLPRGLALDSASLGTIFSDPLASASAVSAAIRQAFAQKGDLTGKIVVFDVPAIALPSSLGPPVFVNDPGHTIAPSRAQIGVSALTTVPVILDALAVAGAVGGVAVLDCPEAAAQGLNAPFFGHTGPNVPTVYVSRDTGRALESDLDAGKAIQAKLVLEASVSTKSSANVVAVIPGMSNKEIIIGTHTDGPNSMEDNGTVGILALASALGHLPIEERPRTVRFVLSGGHFAGSRGIKDYVLEHAMDLATSTLAVIEIEHLGAREWAETSPGTMAATGRPEVQIVSSWSKKPLMDASVAFCKKFDRCVVGGPSVFGEGAYFLFVPLIQFITNPAYLLIGPKPDVTTDLTDYELMRRNIVGFLDMERSLAGAPERDFGLPGLF